MPLLRLLLLLPRLLLLVLRVLRLCRLLLVLPSPARWSASAMRMRCMACWLCLLVVVDLGVRHTVCSGRLKRGMLPRLLLLLQVLLLLWVAVLLGAMLLWPRCSLALYPR